MRQPRIRPRRRRTPARAERSHFPGRRALLSSRDRLCGPPYARGVLDEVHRLREQGSYEDWATIEAADGSVRIGFQQVPESKVVKNRVHIDFAATDEEATAKEIEGTGATRRWVSEDPEDPFIVLPDPEGNEFCIVRAKG
jgi:predicted enzyme related to lactoylglutathione lyase